MTRLGRAESAPSRAGGELRSSELFMEGARDPMQRLQYKTLLFAFVNTIGIGRCSGFNSEEIYFVHMPTELNIRAIT